MNKRKIKKGVIYGLYAFAFITVLGTIYMLEMASFNSELDDTKYVNDPIIENEVPVVKISNKIIRPYNASNVLVARNFYDKDDNIENQVDSLIYHEGTYIPNSGTDYKSNEIFDVLAILDGVVTNVKEDNLLGKIVEITHENNLISFYQSLGEINIEINSQVLQGQVIGKSGNSNIDPSLGNHLHFELIYKGININPEKSYDKKVSEL